MNKIIAVAGVVIKELYRRKDFYVLFILTALLWIFPSRDLKTSFRRFQARTRRRGGYC